MALVNFEVVMEVDDPSEYIPFRANHGSIKEAGKHSLLSGHGDVDPVAAQAAAEHRAIDIFPAARIIAVWETNILAKRIRRLK